MSGGNIHALETLLRNVLADPGYRNAYSRFRRNPQALAQAPRRLREAYRAVRTAVEQARRRVRQ
ncbi:MAG TPA: hypothetical protein VII47_11845, partial [Actinomycetota bacterium]